MTDEPLEPEFNWGTARNACSVAAMFLQLRDEVQGDVNQAKDAFKGSGRSFDFKKGRDKFTVFEGIRPLRTVSFSLNDTHTAILVEQDNGDGRESESFQVMLTLNKEKQCRYLLGTDELESWQLRKRALERLFFTIPVSASGSFQVLS